MRGIGSAEGEEAKKAAVKIVDESLALFEEEFMNSIKRKDFFGEEKIGFLDIAFRSNFVWLKVTEKLNNVKLIDESKIPNLYKWAEKFAAHPYAKDIHPETDKLVEFAKVLFSRFRTPKN